MKWIARASLVIGLILTSITSGGVTQAQVDALVQPLINHHLCKSVVVGLIDPAGRRVYGYGVTKDDGKTPDGQSVFEIGSITKTFTATLLAQMVRSGEVRLDQPVVELLPHGTIVPSKDERQITLLDLTDQTSGLPRLPENLDVSNLDNPYASYTPAMLYEALATIQLTRRPGEAYEYSNLGVGLLGQALADKAGATYEALLVERICKPLAMTSTRITLNEAMKSHLAPGHIGETPVPNWDFDALAGAGAIRSTADDLLTFLAANLGSSDTPIARAMKMTHAVRAPVDDRTDIGMGWHIAKRTGTRWHDGQTSGYHAYAAFVPDKNVGVVVLTNSGTGLIDEVGIQLMRAAIGEQIETVPTLAPQSAPSTRP